MRQLFSGPYWVLLLAVIAAVIGALVVLSTPAVTRWAVEHALRHAPPELELGTIEGSILDEIRIPTLGYRTETLDLTAHGIALRATWRALWRGELEIAHLAADRLTIVLPAASGERAPGAVSPAFALPVPLRIENLQIGHLEIQHGDEQHALADLTLSGSFSGAELTLDHLNLRYRDIPFAAAGHLNLAAPFPLDLQLRAQPGALEVQAQLRGTPDAYAIDAELDSRDPRWPAARVQLTGRGDLAGLEIQHLSAATLSGQVTGAGTLNWTDPLTLRLKLDGKQLNPAAWEALSDYPGRLDVSGNVAFRPGQIDTTARVTGTLRDFPLTASGTFKHAQDRLEIRDGVLEHGPNRLVLTGAVSAQGASDVVFELKAPELHRLHPKLRGSVTGQGRFDGRWRQPRLELTLSGQDTGWHGLQSGESTVTLRPGKGPDHHLDLDLRQLANLGPLQRLRLRADGNPDALRGELALDLPQTRIETRLSGATDWRERVWRGRLFETQVQIAELPPYRQTDDATLTLSAESQRLAGLCVAGPREHACADFAHGAAGNTRLQASLNNLPLRRLGAWLPDARALPGTLAATLTITGDRQAWRGDAEARLDTDNRISANLGLNREDASLSGKLQAHFNKLDWAVLASPDLDAITGNVFADLDLGGTLAEPRLTGPIILGSGALRLPEWGTELEGINLVATLATTRAIIGGQASAGDGEVTLEGDADWADRARWRARIGITGERFEVVDLPTATVAIAPDITLDATPAAVTLAGKIHVTPARIDLGRLPVSVARPSRDEVILNAPAGRASATPQRSLPLRTDLDLVLGERVHLSGRGLDSQLAGALRIRENPGKPLRVFGTLRTVDGKFEAYGQVLKLEKGELTFNGTFKNPAINLRAIRMTDEVTAGLRLIGTLDAPESSVFSDPSLPETDAMAYLLTGKPLSFADRGETSLMLRAVTGLGLAGGARLVDAIRQETGIDVFELESGNDYTDSALLIGKYLTARLYVQYAIKLFEATDIFSLRYKLTRSVQLEAESGTSQGIDLIYQFER
ncbi:MAG: translocation/assembly module TamB domain-containing protein [Thiotrichales bacterium]